MACFQGFQRSADVGREAQKRTRKLAVSGGYISAAAQTIMPEVPGENVVQLFRAAGEYGCYPIGSADNGDAVS